MYLFCWYIYEVLIEHFGEGKFSKLHITGDKKVMLSVLRFLFDSKWIKILVAYHQIIYLSLLKTLVRSGVQIIISQFQTELQPFLDKQLAIKNRDETSKPFFAQDKERLF